MHFKMSPLICFNLDQSKILLSGNGLIQTHVRSSIVTKLRFGLEDWLNYSYKTTHSVREKKTYT